MSEASVPRVIRSLLVCGLVFVRKTATSDEFDGFIGKGIKKLYGKFRCQIRICVEVAP